MKQLSDQAVITIVSALLRRREETLQLKAHFEERSRQGNQHTEVAECLKCTQESLERHNAALRELSEEVAPWVKDYPELQSLFEQSQQTTTSTDDPQLPPGSVMEMADLTKNGVTE
jgi:hypothetical protein